MGDPLPPATAGPAADQSARDRCAGSGRAADATAGATAGRADLGVPQPVAAASRAAAERRDAQGGLALCSPEVASGLLTRTPSMTPPESPKKARPEIRWCG